MDICKITYISMLAVIKIEMSEKDEENSTVIKEIIETGSEIGGGVGGALIGGLMAGPPGAIIGAVSGPVISRLFCAAGKQIRKMSMSNREESRIGFTYATGWHKLKSRLESGDELRADDFFSEDDTNRSTADEILEGVLRSAQGEHEEKKLNYYGNLIANISFDSNVNRNKANLFLKIAQNLSYSQLCILQYLSKNGQTDLHWGNSFSTLEELTPYSHYEPSIAELDQNKLLAALKSSGGSILVMNINKLGKELLELMNLEEIPDNDIDLLSSELDKMKSIITSNKK